MITKLCVICGKEFKPYKRAVERQRYCSLACKNRADKDDRRFGGIRDRVLKRDRYKCVACGLSEGLVVHHKNQDRTDNRMGNLIALCRICHAKIHYPDIWVVKLEVKKCAVCEGEYHPLRKTQKLCRRRACRIEWKNIQARASHESVKCAICGNDFVQKHSNHSTCSSKCRHEYDKQKKRDRYYADREAQLERQKQYYAKNKEKVKAYVTKWRKANPDKVAAYNAKSQ